MAGSLESMNDDYTSLPKVLLHDHLDGGLRPETVIDLARDAGYDGLPHTDVDELRRWFHQGGSFSLEAYLEAFTQTVAVMQTPRAMHRVAYEAAEDLAADGVVYAEIRFAPSQHTSGVMARGDALEAAVAGFADAERDFGIPVRVIVDAMRQDVDSVEVAATAVEFAGRGVVGFDLAGPEAGFPASGHIEALEMARRGGLRITIHAGEGDGVTSVEDAVRSGAERLGHGVRIVEDTTRVDAEVTEVGPVAEMVRERGIPLEVAPTSNLDTGMFSDASAHPIGALHRAGFVVTVNTDNRLMSSTSMSDEFRLLVEHQGFDASDLGRITSNAVDAAFCDEETRAAVRNRVEAGY
jgi:adenosine deaminase